MKTLELYVVLGEDLDAVGYTRDFLNSTPFRTGEINAETGEPVTILLDEDAKVEAYFCGRGNWETITLHWPFLGGHDRAIRQAVREWDDDQRRFLLNDQRWKEATVAQMVKGWTLHERKPTDSEEQAEFRAKWLATEAGQNQIPDRLIGLIRTTVYLLCYGDRPLEDFIVASQTK